MYICICMYVCIMCVYVCKEKKKEKKRATKHKKTPTLNNFHGSIYDIQILKARNILKGHWVALRHIYIALGYLKIG